MAKIRKNPQTEDSEGLTLTQLATRIPKELHRVVKVWCVTHDTSVADFVTDALEHELEARRGEEPGPGKRKAAARSITSARKAQKRLSAARESAHEDEGYEPDDDDDDDARVGA